ncbi:MAG: hypothetical protein QM702_03775 [Rubrivivax sp.]
MNRHPVFLPLAAVRRPLLCLLVLALLAYGQSAVLVQLLGSAHRHAGAAERVDLLDATAALLQQVEDLRQRWHERLMPQGAAPGEAEAHARLHEHGLAHVHAAGAPAHRHAHGVFERHRHDPHDDSVVALDGAAGSLADASALAAAGSAAMPLALAPQWRLPRPAASEACWPAAEAARWRDALPKLSERPPRA